MTEMTLSLTTGKGCSEIRIRIEQPEKKNDAEEPELGKLFFSSDACTPAQWVKR